MLVEAALRLDYNIPSHLKYEKISNDDSCPLCSDSDIFYFIAPFIEGGVPPFKIKELIEEKFNKSYSEAIIINHQLHYKVLFDYDRGLVERQKRESQLLNSTAKVIPISDTQMINDTLNCLYAKIQEMRSNDEVQGKDFVETAKVLLNGIALRNKLINEKDDSTPNFSDIIKSRGKNGANARNSDRENFGIKTSSDGRTETSSN